MNFTTKTGAAILVGLSLLYGALALGTRHSAASEPPADLSAKDRGVDVLQAIQLLVSTGGKAQIIDVRGKEAFDLYHVAGSTSLPEGSASAVLEKTKGQDTILLVAPGDAHAAKLAGEILAKEPSRKVHFVKDGARAFYLALDLPVPLFTDKPVPSGYEEAVESLRSWLRKPGAQAAANVNEALQFLAKNKVEPTALVAAKKAAPGGGGKKKITGGCGG